MIGRRKVLKNLCSSGVDLFQGNVLERMIEENN